MRVATRSDHAILCHRLACLLASGSALRDVHEELGFNTDHSSRVFYSFTGEGLGAFSRRMRLERSAYRIADGRRLREVAVEAGYGSTEAWMKSFKEAYGMSPSQFRALAVDYRLPSPADIHWTPGGGMSIPCGIGQSARYLPELTIASVSLVGDYRSIPNEWRVLAGRLPGRLTESSTQWITLFLDDGLRATNRDSMRSQLGFLLEDQPVPPGFSVRKVRAGVFLQSQPLGGAEEHSYAWQSLNKSWVEKSVANRDQPGFDLYDTIPGEWNSVRSVASLKVFRPTAIC